MTDTVDSANELPAHAPDAARAVGADAREAAAPASGTPPAAGAWLAGSDRPEKIEIRVGFLPLTDCAPVAMAIALGLDQKYGIRIVARREASWAAVRDKLVNGELDAGHALYGMVYGVELGIGSHQSAMAVLMTLNQNGQAITLSSRLAAAGVTDGASLAAHLRADGRRAVFAQTFPTGTHALWLNYWLAAHGIDPLRDVRTVTVPPQQMAANIAQGRIDGFCAGEPWHAHVISSGTGFTAATSQDVWPDHPEKVLASTAEFVQRHPNAARALIAALLEAARFIDASAENRSRTVATIASADYIDVLPETIEPRMQGRYRNGIGRTWDDAHPLRFHAEGAVNFPYLSDAIWFMTQQKRWGMLNAHPDYLAIANRVNRLDLYRDAAAAAGVPLPGHASRHSTLMDGTGWSAADPRAYADTFSIHA
ncbi:CmpA/NrtA family ABC transporter substrate-binding protein [Pararobbsia alpina]|uniref:Nitrate/nitrite binding protein NrtA n=1 Tax=Pararobbsia alpina TaxID=621374 RepID=A0A6S7CUK6_9BURK|nr:CmpA/NrtA family ABC transporter substrate-binding protein [Pararobbsia alpina]CAB3788464.1 Nitrate/nitrite binding protein NrtA [Pararobbsia alpina]